MKKHLMLYLQALGVKNFGYKETLNTVFFVYFLVSHMTLKSLHRAYYQSAFVGRSLSCH